MRKDNLRYAVDLSRFAPWRRANYGVALFILVGGLFSTTQIRELLIVIVGREYFIYLLAVASGLMLLYIAKSYQIAIDRYTPVTQLQAKRANEQIKLTAGFANTIAAACVSVMALTELLKEPPQYIHITIAVAIAAIVHDGARKMVGLLKDESVFDRGRGAAPPPLS